MYRFVLATLLALLLVQPASAQTTFIQRADLFAWTDELSYTTAVVTPELEVWAFVYPEFLDLEIGRLWPLYKRGSFSLAGGGYYVYWPDSGDHFLLPALYGSYEKGRFQISSDLMAYVPLTGQDFWFYNDEAWAGYRVSPQWRLGVAGTFFAVNGRLANAGIGPGLKFDLDKRTTLGFRYLFGVKGADSFRLQVSRTF